MVQVQDRLLPILPLPNTCLSPSFEEDADVLVIPKPTVNISVRFIPGRVYSYHGKMSCVFGDALQLTVGHAVSDFRLHDILTRWNGEEEARTFLSEERWIRNNRGDIYGQRSRGSHGYREILSHPRNIVDVLSVAEGCQYVHLIL